jgi:hypothetical protein
VNIYRAIRVNIAINSKVFVPELRNFSMFLCPSPFCRKSFHKEEKGGSTNMLVAASAACLRRLPLKEAGALRPIEFFSPDTFCNFYTASIPKFLHGKYEH